MPRVFADYQRRVVGHQTRCSLLGMLYVLPVTAAAVALCGPSAAPPAALLAMLFWTFERGILAGNEQLRAEVAAKLRAVGHRVETGRDRFVGLAWPCYYGTARRQVETDDDVGFLTVAGDGLTYLGDGIEFHIPADNIRSVRLRRHAATLFLSNRVEVETVDGEPQETVVFDSRNRVWHSGCNRDNLALCRQIQAVMRPAEAAARLQAVEAERSRLLDA